MKSHLRRAHYAENIRVSEYWAQNFPSLRVPSSGAGKWKGDTFTIRENSTRIELVRRAEPSKCPKCKGQKRMTEHSFPARLVTCNKCEGLGKIKPHKITFFKSEIEDVIKLAKRITELLGVPCEILLVAQFPHFKMWKTQQLFYTGPLAIWNGEDVLIDV